MQLQPLRIPSGWTVNLNSFFEHNIDENNCWLEFSSPAMLSLSHSVKKKHIELCWHPVSDLNGEYHLVVFNIVEKYNFEKEKLEIELDDEATMTFKSKNRIEIAAKIEELTNNLDEYKDPIIYKKRGVIDEKAEAVRLKILENDLDDHLIDEIISNGHSKNQNLLLDSPNISTEVVKKLSEVGKSKGVRNKAKHKLRLIEPFNVAHAK